MNHNTILSPFKGFALQNFPFIEADFDAITNYELMCKIVEHLNKTIEQQNITSENMENLLNWFNNLDVTEEINNKLDAMAQDGTLTDLIKSYIDPLIEEQNNKIDVIDNLVNSVASGSPAGTYLTVEDLESDNPSHDRIYVVIEDGQWYYWDIDTNQWNAGGLYQSSGYANNSIDILMLNNDLQKNFFVEKSDLIEKGNAYVGYYRSDGNLTNDTNYSNYHVALEKGELYYWECRDNAQLNGLVIEDNQNNVVFASNPQHVSVRNTSGVFRCNQNNLTAFLSVQNNVNIPTYMRTYTLGLRKVKDIYNQLRYNSNIPLMMTLENYYCNAKNIGSEDIRFTQYDGFTLKMYQMNKGRKYKSHVWNWAAFAGLLITNTNNKCIYSSSNTNIGNTYTEINYEWTAEEDGYIVVSTKNDGVHNDTTLEVINEGINIIDKNKIKGKKIGADGDSISAGASGQLSYITQIANDNNCTLQNLSIGGGTIVTGTYQNEEPRHWICTSVNNLDTDCDIIMLSGGVNDYWNKVPMGEFTESYSSELDSTTFYGALETMCRNVLNKFKTQKIVFVTYHKINNIYYAYNSSTGERHTFKEYLDAIHKVMDKYSIPVIDLNKKSRLNTAIDYYKNTYTNDADGVHPTNNGYKIFYNDIIINELNNIM